jgi:hypothetical protein
MMMVVMMRGGRCGAAAAAGGRFECEAEQHGLGWLGWVGFGAFQGPWSGSGARTSAASGSLGAAGTGIHRCTQA